MTKPHRPQLTRETLIRRYEDAAAMVTGLRQRNRELVHQLEVARARADRCEAFVRKVRAALEVAS